MKWKEINLPALTTDLSTAQAQPLPRDTWPSWARTKADFSGAWFFPVAGSFVASTTALSTGNVQVYVDFERTASETPPLRYYRCLYAKVMDGRVFQAGPFKNLEYERHRDQRPSWLSSSTTGSTA